MAKDCIAAGCPYFSSSFSNFWAGNKFVYGPLLRASANKGIEFISLSMHALAEEIFDDGIFKLNSPLESGRGCLRVGIKWKYVLQQCYPHRFTHTSNHSKEKILDKKIMANHL